MELKMCQYVCKEGVFHTWGSGGVKKPTRIMLSSFTEAPVNHWNRLAISGNLSFSMKSFPSNLCHKRQKHHWITASGEQKLWSSSTETISRKFTSSDFPEKSQCVTELRAPQSSESWKHQRYCTAPHVPLEVTWLARRNGHSQAGKGKLPPALPTRPYARADLTAALTSAPSKDFFSTATTSSWKATSSTFLGRLKRKTSNAVYYRTVSEGAGIEKDNVSLPDDIDTEELQ